MINTFLMEERDILLHKIGSLSQDRRTALEKFTTFRLKGEPMKVEILHARARNLVIEIKQIDKDIADMQKTREVMSLLII